MFGVNWRFIVPLSKQLWRDIHMKRRDAYLQCFHILGIDDSADQDEVRRAYINLVKKVHPDSGTADASNERFQEVDEAFKMLQEKFAKNRRNIYEDDEEPVEFDIRHTAPQHRQYLNFSGVGIGNPFQRQKQYQQVKAMKAQERVLKHRIEKSTAGEHALIKKGLSNYGKHAVKTKYGIDRIVEDLIQEAMSKGDFNNLSGAGKPLTTTQTQNPYLDFTTHKLNKIMLDNGFTPEWITLSRDIRESVRELKDNIRAERIYYSDWPLTNAEAEEWNEFLNQFNEEVTQLNKLIDKYNLIVPILENQYFRLNIRKMAENILKEEHLPRNVKRVRSNVNKPQNAGKSDSSSFFAIFANFF